MNDEGLLMSTSDWIHLCVPAKWTTEQIIQYGESVYPYRSFNTKKVWKIREGTFSPKDGRMIAEKFEECAENKKHVHLFIDVIEIEEDEE